jgi:hypothetical protein
MSPVRSQIFSFCFLTLSYNVLMANFFRLRYEMVVKRKPSLRVWTNVLKVYNDYNNNKNNDSDKKTTKVTRIPLSMLSLSWSLNVRAPFWCKIPPLISVAREQFIEFSSRESVQSYVASRLFSLHTPVYC